MLTLVFLGGVLVGAVVCYAVCVDAAATDALRPVVREYRDETARRAKLRQADKTPVGGRPR